MALSRRSFLALSGFSLLPRYSRFGSEGRHLAAQTSGRELSVERHESWIELDPAHLRANLDSIRSRVKVPVMAVIKANGYGHGLLEIGHALEQAKIDALMVCKFQEALVLKRSGVTCPIYNFGPLLPQICDDLVRYGIGQFLTSHGHAPLISAARKHQKRARVQVHIDTGMNRMGIPYQAAPAFLEKLLTIPELQIQGVSTTLTEAEAFDAEQIRRLLDICGPLRAKGLDTAHLHAASSAGIFAPPEYYLDMIRPGIALYGYYPNRGSAQQDSLRLKPVLTFKTRIAEVRSLEAGDTASYHRIYQAQAREKIAVLPVGYSDGIPPKLAGKGFVLVRGKRCPIIAGVTANHMLVRLPFSDSIAPGEEAVLIGTQGQEAVTAEDYADWAESSNYKILIGLSTRIPRLIQ
jgi:alanine racemase